MTPYGIKYYVEPGSFTPEGIAGDFEGLCDSILIGSITKADDGSTSYLFFGVDGETGEHIDDLELFKAWSTLAERLSDSTFLTESFTNIASEAFDSVRKIIVGKVENGKGKP